MRSLLVVLSILAASGGAAACSGVAESGDLSLVIQVSQDEITVENRTGASLSKGEVSITPQGIARPYVANLVYMTNGSKHSFPLTSFRMSDGSPFRRDVANGKSVKVTAKDVSGKTYEHEVPFK
jgi:hypothetical protein